LSPEVESAPTGPDRPEPDIIALHAKANDPVISSVEIDASGGAFTAVLPIAASPASGKYWVTAYLVSRDGRDLLGATPLQVP
jgi:hypothetical protein